MSSGWVWAWGFGEPVASLKLVGHTSDIPEVHAGGPHIQPITPSVHPPEVHPGYTTVAHRNNHRSLKLTCMAYLRLILSTPAAHPVYTLDTPRFSPDATPLARRTRILRLPRTEP